ncbi:hypothetical protein NA57DRAFT_48323 [Rhizodiscina lignyota]|uniref:Malic acid transport protein n=1 Tax=Rhizodiscina lignyota TaxID=1504668 RepID=A0A9P4I4K5_9PEZI|nr:hypothetical protein NA57DRAFT_48323 [Rhizodiscina lignyota]
MATGGLALLLNPDTQPHSFDGLEVIGKIVYIFDLVIFSLITAAITYRFIRYPGRLKSSLTHPTESLFFATSHLALASIIGCIGRYGVPAAGEWLVVVYRVLFWIYFAITFCNSVGQYVLLFTSPRLKIQDMTPAWDLPIFPVMLSGTIAAIGAPFQPMEKKIPMIICGLLSQGLGMMVSMLMYASYLRRMINYGLPSPQSRPGMFIAVGPPSFTSLAIIGLANAWPTGKQSYFGGSEGEAARMVLLTLATVVSVFIWSLAFWFFCISVIANLLVSWPFITKEKAIHFSLNWWAFIFPNVGFTIATITIGRELDSQGILWVGSIMTIFLVAMYIFVLVHHVLAVWRRKILWPGRDEDTYVMERMGKIERLKGQIPAGSGLVDINEKKARQE